MRRGCAQRGRLLRGLKSLGGGCAQADANLLIYQAQGNKLVWSANSYQSNPSSLYPLTLAIQPVRLAALLPHAMTQPPGRARAWQLCPV